MRVPTLGRSIPTSLLLSVPLLTAVAGCKGGAGETSAGETGEDPSSIFAAACDKLFTCECADYGFADPAACAASEMARFEERVTEFERLGLTVDLECVAERLTVNRRGCDPWNSDFSQPGEEGSGQCPRCQEAYGDRAVGESCTWIEYTPASECKQGLECRLDWNGTGVCFDPCAPPMVDAPCPAAGCGSEMVCDRLGICVPKIGRGGDECAYGDVICGPGLACDQNWDEDAVCIDGLAPGSPCSDCVFCCAGEYTCDVVSPDPVCVARPALGAACDAQGLPCVRGAYCSQTSGLCMKIPDVGEPCEGFCIGYAWCDEATGTCVEPPQPGDPCVNGACEWSECGANSICAAPPAACVG
jgi:hypothetical protein